MDEVEKLIQKLKGPDAEVRLRAVQRLGELKDPKAVPALIEALKDEDLLVHWDAVRALGNIGDARAVPALIEALEDLDQIVQGTVERALGEIGLGKVRAFLQELVKMEKDPEERKKTRQWAVGVYARIAKTVSKRKKWEMPGEMLEGKIKPPKKTGIYRKMRRAANG